METHGRETTGTLDVPRTPPNMFRDGRMHALVSQMHGASGHHWEKAMGSG